MTVRTHHDAEAASWDTAPSARSIGATDAVVRVDAAAPCGTDLHLLTGAARSTTAVRMLGHESVGTVIQVGSAVTAVHVGDRLRVSCASARGHHRSLLHRCRLVGTDVPQVAPATTGQQAPPDCAGCLGSARCWVCAGVGTHAVRGAPRRPCPTCRGRALCSLCRPAPALGGAAASGPPGADGSDSLGRPQLSPRP